MENDNLVAFAKILFYFALFIFIFVIFFWWLFNSTDNDKDPKLIGDKNEDKEDTKDPFIL